MINSEELKPKLMVDSFVLDNENINQAIKKSIWKTQANVEYFETQKEVNNEPSMTIPDQSMSIQEILTRYAHGLPATGIKVPEFEEDGEEDLLNGVDLRSLDLSERINFIEQRRSELEEIIEAHERIRIDEFNKNQKIPEAKPQE